MAAALHHLEFLVRDGLRLVRQITEQYCLRAVAQRETTCASQWVLGSGMATFVVTQPKDNCAGRIAPEHTGLDLQREKFLRGIDTVFDIAVRVKNVDRILKNVIDAGGEVLLPKTVHSDEHGTCELAVIKSCTGNVVHTLINRESYRDAFLPGFVSTCDRGGSGDLSETEHVRHIDHITIVCQRGDLDRVLSWYQKVFGFKRFLMNRAEGDQPGFVLDGDIGLRLKAMDYFQCAETMLSSDISDQEALRLVIAESLPGHDANSNQVESFIEQHEGPGVQHVGLYTDDIVRTTSFLRSRGVQLQTPPIMYYSHLEKLKEIELSGESLSVLRENGILLDSEADTKVDNRERRYLKQIFTKPIFDRKSFFLELIERQGASGFGTGNIAALWWSVQQSLNLPVTAS